jgi:hypothetical protein
MLPENMIEDCNIPDPSEVNASRRISSSLSLIEVPLTLKRLASKQGEYKMANPKMSNLGILSVDSTLTVNDINNALRRMKNNLALVEMKRRLLSRDVPAADAIRLSSEILDLQEAA